MEAAERQGDPGRLGSYEIVRKLARGGMAELFLAKTVTNSFERLVVLKKILPKYAQNPRFVQLFLDEAKLAASLGHKNVVQVFDIGNDGGHYFFAMEYLHGQDVRTILHRAWRNGEKMPFKFAVQVASQIASALHYAHEKRRSDGSLLELVHRDVSPSNVIVTYEGAIKLLDFGVAKASTSTIKTRTGTLKGKIAYMSPEQARGGSLDRRSDIFSLGIVLWEMATTQRLFKGDNDLATLQLIINEPPKRPSLVNPDVPVELDRIIQRALAQDVSRRYQTAHELALDLEGFVRDFQLVQSSSALSVYMGTLFQEEIVSWQTAQARGVELSEHLTSVGDMTTPVSDSEFIEPMSFANLDDDDDDLDDELDDDEQEAVAGLIDVPPRRDATPVPRQVTAPPVGAVGPVGPVGMMPSSTPVLRAESHPAVPRTRTDPGLVASTLTPSGGMPQRAWPPAMQTIAPDPHGEVFTPEQAARWHRNAGYVGACVLVLIIVVALAAGH